MAEKKTSVLKTISTDPEIWRKVHALSERTGVKISRIVTRGLENLVKMSDDEAIKSLTRER